MTRARRDRCAKSRTPAFGDVDECHDADDYSVTGRQNTQCIHHVAFIFGEACFARLHAGCERSPTTLDSSMTTAHL
jgi:hypothetical protein